MPTSPPDLLNPNLPENLKRVRIPIVEATPILSLVMAFWSTNRKTLKLKSSAGLHKAGDRWIQIPEKKVEKPGTEKPAIKPHKQK